ncbi:hypothetical protein [Nocardiopsis rhodophaea]
MPSRILRSTAGTLLALLFCLAVLALTASFLIAYVPDGDRAYRAYQQARPCPSPPQEAADCLWRQEFTASDIVVGRGRRETGGVTLTAEDGSWWRARSSEPGPVLRRLEWGQKVTGTVWRGRLTEIATEGVSQRTEHFPVDMRNRTLTFALIIAPSGLMAAAVCLWRLLRRREPTRAMVATLGLSEALPFAGVFCAMALADDGHDPFWPTVAAWLPVAGLMALSTWVYATHDPPEDDPLP